MKIFNSKDMEKIGLVPGKKYKGHFWLNEYGQIQVQAEQKGTKPNNMKIVLESKFFTLYESKYLWKVSVQFDKVTFSAQHAYNVLLFVVSQIKQYTKS